MDITFKLEEEGDKQYEKWVEETREKVAIGIAQLDRGEGIDGEIVMAKFRDKLKKAGDNAEMSQKLRELFDRTQALPGVQNITEEEIIAEIELYRRGQ